MNKRITAETEYTIVIYGKRLNLWRIFLPITKYMAENIAPEIASKSPLRLLFPDLKSIPVIMIPPTIAINIPEITTIDNFSFKIKCVIIPTKTGVVDTRTTALATVVILKEVIHKVKCIAREKPADIIIKVSFLFNLYNLPCLHSRKGMMSNIEAIAIR